MKHGFYFAVTAVTLAACHHVQEVPMEPAYCDSSQWYIVDRRAEVDIFYITSTETDDYTMDGVVRHFSDTYNDSLRALLLSEMNGVDQLLGNNFNFYSPYYRQCTMETFTDTALITKRIPLAMGDVEQAFAYYLEHLNGGRPFILAGFSQGGVAVVDLLKTMDDKSFNHMVAAYVIGWKVTDSDLAATTHIHAAQDSTDLGVTICYNSVRTPDCAIPLLSEGNRLAINPINWQTDGTPATLVFREDTLTIALDTSSRLLCVDGYTRDDYMLPLIGVDGNYHCLELLLYASHLRRNMNLRAERMTQ